MPHRHDGDRWAGWQTDAHYQLSAGALRGAHDDERQVGFGFAWDGATVQLGEYSSSRNAPRRTTSAPDAVRPYLELRWRDRSFGASMADANWSPVAGQLIRQTYEQLQTTYLRQRLSIVTSHISKPLLACAIGIAHPRRQLATFHTAAMDRSVEFNAMRIDKQPWAGISTRPDLSVVFQSPTEFWPAPSGINSLTQACNNGAMRWSPAIADEMPAARSAAPSYHPGQARTLNGDFANGPDEPGYGSCWSAGGRAGANDC